MGNRQKLLKSYLKSTKYGEFSEPDQIGLFTFLARGQNELLERKPNVKLHGN